MRLNRNFLNKLNFLSVPPKNSSTDLYFGYHCVFTPEEIIHAAEFTPVRLFPKADNPSCNRSCLHARSCDFARRILENFNDGKFAYLKGAVFTHCCDTLRAVFEILKKRYNYLYYLDIPFSTNGTSVNKKNSDLNYFCIEFKHFTKWLEKKYKVRISDKNIYNSRMIYQKNRKLIKKLTQIYKAGIITTTDYFLALRVGYYIRKENHNDILEELLEILSKAINNYTTSKGIPVMILGSINANHMPWIKYFEDLGLRIIAEDLCDFRRYNFDTSNEHLTENYKQLVIDTFHKHCPAKLEIKNRVEAIYEKYQQYGAKGIIFMIYQYCDVQEIDYIQLKKGLSANDIPTLLLYPTVHFNPSGQMDTRIEAFLEMIKNKKEFK